MKVLFLVDNFSDSKNPYSGTFFYNQIIALKKYGLEIHILYLDFRSIRKKRKWGLTKYQYKDVDVYRFAIPCGPFYKLLYFLLGKFSVYAFAQIKKREGMFDLVHAHFFNMGYAARKIYEQCGVPYIVTEHSSFLLQKNKKREMEKHLFPAYEKAKTIIAVGNNLKEKMKLYTNKEIIVVPNILPEIFSYSVSDEKDSAVFRYISIVGTLTKEKRIDLVVETFAKLVYYKKNIELYICGEGRLMEKLKERVRDLKLENSIKFLGVIDNYRLPNLLKKCDCFVLPSVVETFGVVYIEAIGCGLPVIAAHSGGADEIVNEKNGIIIENDNIEDLLNAMSYMYDNRDKYNSVEISNDIMEKFGEKAFGDLILPLYHEAIH
jgi:glycosyltransferase involved in cell wall biosynthesis